MTQKEMIEKIVRTLDIKKAEDIKVIGIRDLTVLTDYFIIANGNSSTHTKALAEEVDFKLSQEGIEPRRREDDHAHTWVVLDYADIIVHVFSKETRNFYQLEHLWADGEQVDINEYLIEE